MKLGNFVDNFIIVAPVRPEVSDKVAESAFGLQPPDYTACICVPHVAFWDK